MCCFGSCETGNFNVGANGARANCNPIWGAVPLVSVNSDMALSGANTSSRDGSNRTLFLSVIYLGARRNEMRKATILIFSAVAFAAALFGDDANELKSLQVELSQIQAAEQSFDAAAKKDNPADAMLKLIHDDSLARLYEKWSGEKWATFASSIEKEISIANRRYKVPKATPGAAEEMLAILEPNLKELKKKYLAMSKGDPGWESLTRQMVEQKKKVDEFKKQAEEEKAAEKEKIDNAVSARQEAFLKISENVKDKLQSGVRQPLKKKIAPIKNRIVAKERAKAEAERERAEAAIRKAEAEEAARLEQERKELEPKYREKKSWYDYQIDYNGLREQEFFFFPSRYGPCWTLIFTGPGHGGPHRIEVWPNEEGYNLRWSQSFQKGFAQELIEARILIYMYENPLWEEEYQKKVRDMSALAKKRSEEQEAREAEVRKEAEKERRSSYKSYIAPKRKINPDLKRFKRNDRFAH